MKYTIASLLLGASLVAAEVPQEHSHNFVLALVRTSLNLNNPKGIQDPVFGLLGNAAAANGAGTVTNLDCLQQETADQAFTNAKAIKDIPGMAGALLFRAIERNTLGVGVKSVLCTEKAVNPEIAALTQHQDPASDGAAATNKGITLELAKQLALIGADPLLALESGTFAPGDRNDATGRGNACDTDPNEPGCIFTDKLLVLDASVKEVQAAVAGIAPTFTGTGVLSATHIDFNGLSVAGGGVQTGTPSAGVTALPDAIATATDQCVVTTVTVTSTPAAAADACVVNTVTVTAGAAAAASSCSVITTTVEVGATTLVTAAPVATATATPVQAGAGAGAGAGGNLQSFTGTLGGPAPPVVSGAGDRPFTVNGNTFNNLANAITRSCDIQNNACFNAVNSKALAGGTGQCADQLNACKAGGAAVARRQAGGFGSCSDPTIVFKAGLDGRRENSFIANNLGDFQHGSALNIGVIASFICERLSSSCKAPAGVVATCQQARQAAIGAQQNQAAADAFNRIILGGAGAGAGAAAPAAAPAVTAAPVAKGKGKAKANGKGKGKGKVQVLTVTQCS